VAETIEPPAVLTLRYRLDDDLVPGDRSSYRHVERWGVSISIGDADVGDARLFVLDVEPGTSVADLTDPATGTWVDRPATAGATGPVRHVLVLDRVWIHPDHRGHGYGPIVAAAAVDRLGRGCDLAACYPAPFENPELSPAERDRSIVALAALWSTVGFEHWRDGVWMIDLQHHDARQRVIDILGGGCG
jgi:GNAT superfamily N-acetyltransferase